MLRNLLVSRRLNVKEALHKVYGFQGGSVTGNGLDSRRRMTKNARRKRLSQQTTSTCYLNKGKSEKAKQYRAAA
jgi:hypothetical protein